MAEKNEKNLIGYNPLAWMDDESSEINDSTNDTESNKDEDKVEEIVNSAEETSDDNKASESLVKSEDLQGENTNDSKITLEATLNIQNVGALYEKLLKLLESQNIIEIDASAVTLIDTASLQLLIVLKQSATELHKEVTIDFPSEKFIEAAELLGLSELLEVDQSAAGFF